MPFLRTLAAVVLWTAAATAAELAAQTPADSPRFPDPPAGLDAFLPFPPDNPPNPAAVELGRRLFFDPILSADRRVSCATCHLPERAFADTTAVSIGVYGRAGHRNAPSLLNAGYLRHLFWDGRAEGLEAQVVGPIRDPAEMDLPLDSAVARLRESDAYRHAFHGAFAEPPTRGGLARALASFVRLLRSGDSDFDRFRAGDLSALSPEAQAGFRLFTGKANCAVCHMGATLTDDRFHNTGVAWRGAGGSGADARDPDAGPRDPGRFQVTGDSTDLGAFRTPSLRNVELTAPYMHDGSIATLDEVVDFYAEGGHPNPYLDRRILPLRMTAEERGALVEFLKALTGRTGMGGG